MSPDKAPGKPVFPHWKPIYSRHSRPVIMERPWGKGAIVLCGDTFPLSNEAMQQERHPELLAWLAGPARDIIFDETHLGTQEAKGVMTLIRKYRLTGLLAALILVALLYVWRNASVLGARRDTDTTVMAKWTEGREATAGLVNLLRRSIPTRDILAACYQEWERAFANAPGVHQAKRARIKAIMDEQKSLPPRERNPVRAYQIIRSILMEKK